MLLGRATFRRLVRARELLADDDASVRVIAETVGLSPFHFIRQFAALYGATPHQLRTELRIARAKALLARGMAVTDVCHEVGYASVGSFSALFTRWHGTSPTRYRTSVAVPRQVPAITCLGFMAQLPPDAYRNFREARA